MSGMPGSYLDQYGVDDAKRAHRWKLIVGSVVAAALIGTFGFFFLQTFFEERTVSQFVDLLKSGKYQDAYQFWQTPETQKYYPFEKFNEDFGPKGVYGNVATLKISDADNCEGGVVFALNYPGQEPTGLWVDKQTKKMSFYDAPRCRRRHWEFGAFFKRMFGGS
jgi:hypothetical protein